MPQLGLHVQSMDFYERLNANLSSIPLSIPLMFHFHIIPLQIPLNVLFDI